jgi:hypothetical protein
VGFTHRSLVLPTVIVLSVIITVLFFLPLHETVVVFDDRTGKVLASFPLVQDSRFELRYTHSVNKGAVRDFFHVDHRGHIILEESIFQSFGAGMEEGLDGPEALHLRDEGLVLTDLDRDIGELRLAIGSVAEHRLIFGAEQELALTDICEPFTFVTIAYRRRGILHL